MSNEAKTSLSRPDLSKAIRNSGTLVMEENVIIQ